MPNEWELEQRAPDPIKNLVQESTPHGSENVSKERLDALKSQAGVSSKPRGLTHTDLDEIFRYHPPSLDQSVAYDKLRTEARQFARAILDLVPSGPDQTVAIRKLRECVMTANAGIALHGKY